MTTSVEIKKLAPGEAAEFSALVTILNTVFENEKHVASMEYLSDLLSRDDLVVFVSTVSNKVVGGLTIYVLRSYYSGKSFAYIYDVGVLPEFQGKGIGKALINAVGCFCRENGLQEAYVEAEMDDADAIAFYKRTDYTYETRAVHFTYLFGGE